MRLTENKEDLIVDRVCVRIERKEYNIFMSNWVVLNMQDIWVRAMVNSNDLIRRISDEIGR